jgi:hypothetical protein
MYFGGAESKIPQWPPGAELTRSGSKYKQRDEICVFGGGGGIFIISTLLTICHISEAAGS